LEIDIFHSRTERNTEKGDKEEKEKRIQKTSDGTYIWRKPKEDGPERLPNLSIVAGMFFPFLDNVHKRH
jgi:hypothetical protein